MKKNKRLRVTDDSGFLSAKLLQVRLSLTEAERKQVYETMFDSNFKSCTLANLSEQEASHLKSLFGCAGLSVESLGSP